MPALKSGASDDKNERLVISEHALERSFSPVVFGSVPTTAAAVCLLDALTIPMLPFRFSAELRPALMQDGPATLIMGGSVGTEEPLEMSSESMRGMLRIEAVLTALELIVE